MSTAEADPQVPPQALPARPTLILLARHVDTVLMQGQVKTMEWHRKHDQEKAAYLAKVQANMIQQLQGAYPGHLFSFDPPRIGHPETPNIILGENRVIHQGLPIQLAVNVFRPQLVAPSPEARENFIAWAGLAEWENAEVSPVSPDVQATLNLLADHWASGARPTKVRPGGPPS